MFMYFKIFKYCAMWLFFFFQWSFMTISTACTEKRILRFNLLNNVQSILCVVSLVKEELTIICSFSLSVLFFYTILAVWQVRWISPFLIILCRSLNLIFIYFLHLQLFFVLVILIVLPKLFLSCTHHSRIKFIIIK